LKLHSCFASFFALLVCVLGSFGGGDGSIAYPYLVEDAADLNAVRNGLALHYQLANNIDLSAYLSSTGAGYNAGQYWQPIGTFQNITTYFTGSFNGIPQQGRCPQTPFMTFVLMAGDFPRQLSWHP
jgi:hypothetical protein